MRGDFSGAAQPRKKALRLWAWRWTQKLSSPQPEFIEAYSCTRDCYRDGWTLETRKGRGCTRPDLPPILWQINIRDLLVTPSTGEISAGLYRGRMGHPSMAGTVDMIPVDPDEPHERTADGCPGGWYRTAYLDSVARYMRRRTDHGGRVANPFFDDTDTPWQVREAVMYVEEEQERYIAWRAGEIAKIRERNRAREARRGSKR